MRFASDEIRMTVVRWEDDGVFDGSGILTVFEAVSTGSG
jgi:hypothetical protein